jgi:hypothetical protein
MMVRTVIKEKYKDKVFFSAWVIFEMFDVTP